MTLNELNYELIEKLYGHFENEETLLEWWATEITKKMKEKGTTGAFTQWCKNNNFKKASYECIKTAIKKADEVLQKFDKNSKEYKEALLLKRRATLAKTFKKWAKQRKK